MAVVQILAGFVGFLGGDRPNFFGLRSSSRNSGGSAGLRLMSPSQGPVASFMETFDSHSRTAGWSSEVLAARHAVEQLVGDLFDNDIDQVCHGSGHSSAGSSANRLTLLTLAVGLSTAYMDILRADRKRLADTFGYESCIVTHSLTDERAIVWSKLIAVRKLLEHGRSKVAWIDADALIANPERFENIADPYFGAGKQIVFTNDFDEGDAEASPRSSINLGVFVTLNTEWTREFWRSIYDEFPEALGHHFQEQQAVMLYRNKYPENFESHAQIVRNRLMNSLLSRVHPTDFVVHAAGGKANRGKYEQLITYYCQRVHVTVCHAQGSALTEMDSAVDSGHEAITSKSEPLADGEHAIADDALDKHGAAGSFQVALNTYDSGTVAADPVNHQGPERFFSVVEGDTVESVPAVAQQTMDH